MPLRCEEVREVLPDHAEGRPRPAGEVEEHVAGCVACGAELDAYRAMLSSLASLRELDLDPSSRFLQETLRTVRLAYWSNRIPSVANVRVASVRVVGVVRERKDIALASLGGAVVGATAIALVARRLARRATERAATPA